MNVTVTCEGVELDTYLISYTREDNICNSTSVVTLSLSINCPTVFDFYDTIIITEDGVKKGTYALLSIEKSMPQGVITLTGSNSQKSLENYFISDKYDISDTPTLKTLYWIEKFMAEAGVTYNVTATGDGEFLPSDLVLGGVMAIDAVKQLLQYSGWYMRYDEDGVAIIGTLDYDSDEYSVEIEGDDIIDFKIEENDAMLRNRVVVWGMGSTLIENNGWTFVDLSVTTPWNYDENDVRTVLISNSMISDSTLAQTLAKKTLDEFTKPNIVKTIKVKGFVNAMVGDRIFVDNKYYSKICTVTTIYVGMEQSGTTTTLTLDERCPRLIGYFNYGGYVYVGTDGDGVWRKPLKYSDDWEDYSTGITDLHITDLSIAGGVMACVTESHHLYVRYPSDTQWNRVSSFSLYDEVDKVTYTTASGEIVACSVDRNSGVVYAGIHYQISDSGYRSWVGKVYSPTEIVTTNIVTNSGNNYYLTDLDSNSYGVYPDVITRVVVTTSGSGSGKPPVEVFGGLHITRNTGNFFGNKFVNEYGNYNTSYNMIAGNIELVGNNPLNSSACYGKYMFYYRNGAYRYDTLTGEQTQIAVTSNYTPYLHAYSTAICYAVINESIEDASHIIRVRELDFGAVTFTDYDQEEVTGGGQNIIYNGSYIIDDNIYIIFSDGFYAKMWYRVFNVSSHTFSPKYEIYIDGTNTYREIGVSGSTLLYDKVVGAFIFQHKTTVPRTYDVYTFRIDTTGSVETLFQENLPYNYYYGLHPQIADFTTNTIFAIKHYTSDYNLRTIARINDDLTVSDIVTLDTNIATLSSSKTMCYIITIDGNVYDLSGSLLGDLDIASSSFFTVSGAADDYDDALIVFNTTDNASHNSKIERHKFIPSRTTTVLLDGLTITSDRSCILFGERIWVAGNVYQYTGTDDTKPPVSAGTTTNIYLINHLLEYRNNEFLDVGVVNGGFVDSSQDFPVATYGGDEVFNNGYLDVYMPPDILRSLNLIAVTPSGLESNYVYDVRSFSQIVPGSGYLRRTMFTRNTVIDGSSWLQLVDYDLATTPPWVGYEIDGSWVAFSGTAKFLETSNYGDNPYFFVSLAGSPSPFYQKDKYDNNEVPTAFEEHTFGLPDSEIKIIRVDDLV